jgi:hypothetical protein
MAEQKYYSRILGRDDTSFLNLGGGRREGRGERKNNGEGV